MSLYVDTRRTVRRRSLGARLGGALHWLRARQIRARQRHEVARLTDRDLADIGVSRAALAAELAKPFWRR